MDKDRQSEWEMNLATKKKESARALALRLLEQILDQGGYSNLLLQKELKASTLSNEDKGLVTELVYGTISRKISLEWYLAPFVEDRNKLDKWVYDLLLMALYQYLYLERIPDHALVYETVELAKRKPAAANYVNAILRRILREGLADPTTIRRKNKRLSILYSMPVWLIKTLTEEFGLDRAEAIAKASLDKNKLSLRVVDLSLLEEIKQRTDAQYSALSSVGLTLKKGNLAESTYFKKGQVTIQDESSQLVAPSLRLEGWEKVLDACAAPGGKTCHLASYLKEGQVTALDIHEHKLSLIEENARRLGVENRIRLECLDARQSLDHFGPESFDKALVDAPCSGIGLIRRKPDIKYRKEAEDFQSLQKLQLQILDSVCQTVKKGGIITYSTCTIIRKENQEVLEKFLASHPNFEQVVLEHPQKEIMVDGCLLITPEQFGTDGFFIGQVRRIS